MGGLIGLLKSFTRTTLREAQASEVKYDPGAGKLKAGPHFSAAGDDSHPLPGDYVLAVPTTQSGMTAAVGYLDPVNVGVAEPGDKRIYARDADGAVVATVWLKHDGHIVVANDNVAAEFHADGTVEISNGSGAIELQAGGTVDINGLTIDTNGNLSTPGTVEGDDVTATGTDVTTSTHTHSSGGSGPPIPGT